jgi:hypothetical protein
MGASNALAAVTMIVQLSTGSPAGFRQRSHSPAKANGAFSASRT